MDVVGIPLGDTGIVYIVIGRFGDVIAYMGQ